MWPFRKRAEQDEVLSVKYHNSYGASFWVIQTKTDSYISKQHPTEGYFCSSHEGFIRSHTLAAAAGYWLSNNEEDAD